jgi:phosphatidylserine/phosphatidylglycerophosphate/cardiolipin synthase-like enzyme
MCDTKIPLADAAIGIETRREARLTMPWFVREAKYPPRAGNLIEPLINGERAFAAVHEAISKAKKSVDIISWGFDPSMRLTRPGGERLGDLLRRKSEAPFGTSNVEVRVLIWKNALANFGENNIVGDGLLGSGGTTGLGSGVGSTGSGGGSASGSGSGTPEYNDYAGKRSDSAAVQGDAEAQKYNRAWFRYQPPSMEFRTRDFSLSDRTSIIGQQVAQRGLSNPSRTYLMADFASHHQKMILVDYESPADAIGFVMGHNLLRNYWDTDAHEYQSAAREGFAPWQDLSCRVRGGVLYDLNENFMKAWDKAEGMGSKFFWTDQRKALKWPALAAAAGGAGSGEMAQICRTQPQEGDRSILDSYKLALSNARDYLYFENQYFRYKDFAELLRCTRRKLKSAGWKRDFYIFVVTNTPPGSGRLNTYEMLAALGKGQLMPALDKSASSARDPDAALRKADLTGVNIHVATLCASAGGKYKEIYVHSKLLLVDDIFFTLGSANVNVRSMEGDSELNIAAPSPALTKQWRTHLWQMHAGTAPSDTMENDYQGWLKVMEHNAEKKAKSQSLQAPLLSFLDNDSATFAPD